MVVYREVIVRLVLNDRIIPAITDHDAFQFNFLRTWGKILVLLLNVLIEHRSVMSSITLRGEMEFLARILRKRTHETLQRAVEVRSSGIGRISRQGDIRVRVRAAGRVLRVVRTGVVGQGDNVARVGVDVAGHGDAVGESGLGGLVDI